MKNQFFFSLLLLIGSSQLFAQHHIPGTWEGVMTNDSTGKEQKITISIVIPKLSKSHKCGYEEALVKSYVQIEKDEKPKEYHGILSFDCRSINLYSKNVYGPNFSYYKGFLYRDNLDYYQGKVPTIFTVMQLIFKNGKPHGYWQSGNHYGTAREVIHQTGKVIFTKHQPLKQT